MEENKGDEHAIPTEDSLQKTYSLSEYVCIVEMLIPIRERWKFRVYIPKKPNKYGLKVLAMTDAQTGFFTTEAHVMVKKRIVSVSSLFNEEKTNCYAAYSSINQQ